MSTFTDIRTIPGLYGGGFGRVVDVQALSGSRVSAGTGGQDALVRLERLRDPLQGFRQTVQQYFNDRPAVQTGTSRLSGNIVTLLQQIDENGEIPLGPQLPPLGPQLPAPGNPDVRPAEVAKETAQSVNGQSREKNAERSDEEQGNREDMPPLLMPGAADEKVSFRPALPPFGPDLLANLEKLFERRAGPEFTLGALSLQEIGGLPGAVLSGASQAALAAKAYAASLGNLQEA